jgi:hypothetical protein
VAVSVAVAVGGAKRGAPFTLVGSRRFPEVNMEMRVIIEHTYKRRTYSE